PAQVRWSRIEEPDRFVPVSGATARPVVVGAVRSMMTGSDDIVTCGPAREDASTTVRAARNSRTVPSEQPLTGSWYTAPEPVGAPMTQPVAVPEREKSVAARPVTGFGNVTSKVSTPALVMRSVALMPVSDAADSFITAE